MAFPSVLNLSTLDGTNGFVINGIAAGDFFDSSVSNAGDVNNDGYDDLIIGAPSANNYSGQSYVIFGGSNLGASFDLSSLNGSNGFTINGIAVSDQLGYSVSGAGDVNNDGYDDLIIGAPYVSLSSFLTGQSYVVFGGSSFGASLDLSSLNGSNGFTINGNTYTGTLGYSVSSAGDVNGDNIDDLIVGVPSADPNGADSGQSYVVFGGSGFSTSLDPSSLNGSNGFAINGIAFHESGYSVSNAGDVNNDGYDDLIIGAPGANNGAGQSYVVFGGSSFNASIDLSTLNGTNGFAINGITEGDYSGRSVSGAGDVNNDGYDDLIVGVYEANNRTGQSYVVFGGGSFGASIDLSSLNGINGFTINGLAEGDQLGISISSAGDVNDDGIDDLIIGAPFANGYLGSSYVIFGGGSFGASFDPSTLDGSNGFAINGYGDGYGSGYSVSNAGDVNNDGIDDLIVMSPYANNYAGASYVVYGMAAVTNQPPLARNDSATTAYNTAVNIPVSTLLANDYDPDSDPLSITGVSGASHGTAVLNDNGTPTNLADDYVTFTPTTNYSGSGSFDYTLSDGSLTDTGTVNVAVGINLTGTNQDDILNGTPGDDNISGLQGKDTLNGFAGNDTLLGGNGKDLLIGGTGNDVLGGQGNEENSPDVLIGVDPNSLNPGVNEIDTLTGGGGPDTFVLGDANSVYYNDFDYYYSFQTDTGYLGKGQFSYDGNPAVVLESGAGPTDNLQFLSLSVFDPANNLLDSGNSVVDGISSDGYLYFEFNTGTETLDNLDNNTEASGSDPYYFISNAVDPDYNYVGPGNTDFNLFAFSPQTPGISDFLGYTEDILISPGNGNDDYALITDFTTQDVIQLKGSAADYVLDGNYTLGGSTGTAIFLNETVDDLIAFVQGVTGLNLNSNAFSFV